MKLKDVMSKRVVTTSPTRTLRHVARLMNRFEIGSVVVREGGKVLGIVTERDVLRIVAAGRDPDAVRVNKVMSRPVVVAEDVTDLADAVKAMVLHKIKKLPVVRKGRLVGIVTTTDFARVGPIMQDLLVREVRDAGARSKKEVERIFRQYLGRKDPPADLYA